MKAAIFAGTMDHHRAHAGPVAEGLKRHGIEVEFYRDSPPIADFVVTWGWARAKVVHGPVLVLERGYLGDRMNVWTSAGWDGLNGRARFPQIDDPTRFDKHFGADLKPWRKGDGYALLVGQVRTDTAVDGTDIIRWYKRTTEDLRLSGWDVRFRQHPREIERNFGKIEIPGTVYSKASLADDLAGAAYAITFNSNTGVDAIMAGVPVYTEDEGSMVWPIASHDGKIVTPDRRPHLNRLAWCQWQKHELADGSAWEAIRQAM